ncbi:MAG: hypothetical protein RJA22_1395 [Verrucomicrobiota bacterium]
MTRSFSRCGSWLRLLLGGVVAAGLCPGSLRADATLTECSEAALREALAIGGRITIACDGIIAIQSNLWVTTDTFLDAGGRRVSLVATGSSRLFLVQTGVHFTAYNLTLAGGRSTAGAAIYNDRGFLSLQRCVFSNNVAEGKAGLAGRAGADSEFQNGGPGHHGTSGGPAWGGAIFNRLGTTVVDRCLFLTNAAAGGAGGAGGVGGNGGRLRGGTGGRGGAGGRAQGGAIFNTGLLVVSNSTFQFNAARGGAPGAGGAGGSGLLAGRAGHGGAGAPAWGGAIYNTNRATLHVHATTFSLNTAQGAASASGGYQAAAAPAGWPGGGAFGGAIASLGTQAVVNSTFFANRITGGSGGNGADGQLEGGRGGDGGAAAGGQVYSGKHAALTNCTLYSGGAVPGTNGLGGNAPFKGKNGRNGPSRGGNLANGNGTFVLKNCLVADPFTGTNGYGAFTDAGYNLSTDRSLRLRGAGSMTNTPAGLGSFGRNGGPTETIPLVEGSAAIDRGDPAFVLATDQRGVARPYGGRADIGSYEYGLTLLPPVIVTDPLSRVAQVGDTVTFLVVARGDPPLTYQWRRNGSAVAGADSPVLTLVNVQPSDFTSYDVIVVNNSGSATSASATLSRITPVSITQAPQPQTVDPGGSANFSVSASGDGPISYQWRFRGVAILGANLTTFNIPEARETDAGPYDVVAFNSFSSVTSAPALLTVGTNAPVILVQPEGATADSGKTVELRVVAAGSQPLFFQWFRNGTEALPGGTNPVLTLTNLQPPQAGSYTVVVSNALGTVTSAPAVLTVNAVPPTITGEPPERVEPCHGDPVTLTVIAQGTEPLLYQWYRDGQALTNATNATLSFPAEAAQAGTYYAEVSNDLGSIASADALVEVTDGPRITAPPADTDADAGSRVELRVQHCPTPGPFGYQWFREGIAIPGATNASHVIANVSYAHAGAYTVNVTNLFGAEESLPATLTVLVPAAQVTVQVRNANDPLNPVEVTYTFAAQPGVLYTGYFRYSSGDEWQAFGSAELPDEIPGALALDFVGDVLSPAPLFRIVGEALP